MPFRKRPYLRFICKMVKHSPILSLGGCMTCKRCGEVWCPPPFVEDGDSCPSWHQMWLHNPEFCDEIGKMPPFQAMCAFVEKYPDFSVRLTEMLERELARMSIPSSEKQS